MTDLGDRVRRLSPQQRENLLRRLEAAQQPGGSKRLAAYVVPQAGAEFNSHDLREYVQRVLPAYMKPAQVVILKQLPRTANGKVDRLALSEPRPVSTDEAAGSRGPRDATEKVLAEIWQEVLGISAVSIDDNFFEVGGDSLQSLRIIAKANQAGIQLSSQQFFDHPTVAGLAGVAVRKVGDSAGAATRVAPLMTPIQHWFFDRVPDCHEWWNQSVLLEAPRDIEAETLRRGLDELVRRHEALRWSFSCSETGWRVGHGDVLPVPFQTCDAECGDEDCHAEIERVATELHSCFRLDNPPLVRGAYFDFGLGKPSRLLIVIHHLVVDGVSWGVLLHDLADAVRAVQSRSTMSNLEPAAFSHWAQQLTRLAQSEEVRGELDYWLSSADGQDAELPLDALPPADQNTNGNCESVVVDLDARSTKSLVRDVHAAYRTQPNDLLLAALLETVTEWTGRRVLQFDLEGHGRAMAANQLDVSQTVGWFTTVYPVRLERCESEDIGERLATVKEQLRAIPSHGSGHGLLRYLAANHEIADQLAAQPASRLLFNYLGTVDPWEEGGMRLVSRSTGQARNPAGQRAYLLEANLWIAAGRLRMEWTFYPAAHQRSTIQKIAERFTLSLAKLIEHCCQRADRVTYTPSDFPLAGLDQQELNEVSQLLEAIDDEHSPDDL